MKKVKCLCIVVLLLCSMCTPCMAYAGNAVILTNEFVDFTKMTNAELNNIAEMQQSRGYKPITNIG